MLSAVIAALAFGIMVVVIVSLVISATRERRHSQKALMVRSAQLPTLPLLESSQAPKRNLSPLWYSSRRTLVSLGLLLMFSIVFVVQGGLAGGTIQTLGHGLGLSFFTSPNSANNDVQAIAHTEQFVSKNLKRIYFADPTEYRTNDQLVNWASSACSELAMTEVMNSYGRNILVSDVVQEELNLGVWDPNLGLLRDDGVALTASHFGFKTAESHSQTVQQIVDIANHGHPVIVSVRNYSEYPNGHLFVMTGGDTQSVTIVDSSSVNLQHISWSGFQAMWEGFSAVLTPQQ